MEELMYLVWQQRMFQHIATLDGRPLDILHPGLRNLDAGPDFFNAKLRIDGVTWAGNVEMHVKASDWHRHHHDDDPAYGSVILHVVLVADVVISLRDGRELPTVVMTIPPNLLQRYDNLIAGRAAPLLPGQPPRYITPSCGDLLSDLPPAVLHDWITALCTQRMMDKMQRVTDIVEHQMQAWSEAFYVVLTRSLGTGINSDAMERLARSLPFKHLLHHSDNLLQLKALLLGQAGFLSALDAASRPADEQQEWRLMQREYAFLRQKFQLTPLPIGVWHIGRVRPPAQPDARLSALALLLHTHRDLPSQVLDAHDLPQMERLLSVKGLGLQTKRSLIINAIVPMLLAHAQWQGDEALTERALGLLEQMPPEANRYVKLWTDAGIRVRSALDSQALLHLTLHYCQPHKCLRCRIGCWLLRRS